MKATLSKKQRFFNEIKLTEDDDLWSHLENRKTAVTIYPNTSCVDMGDKRSSGKTGLLKNSTKHRSKEQSHHRYGQKTGNTPLEDVM